jgi:TonB family protein
MEPGDQIGSYTIVSEIGGGGMSLVYLADDATTGARVVVKQLREQYAFDTQLVDRFLRGATAVKDLRHPHLARVLEWRQEKGRFYTVEEYLSGGSLADLLKNGPPSQTDALTWCRDALRALNYVHEFGIVHRDIKPSNLMLDEHRNVRVIDFGIARVFGDKRLTRTGDGAIGTACYMSPEQIRTLDEVDHLTDVYAAGVVLYELLTGSVPFDGPTDFAIKEKIIHQSPPPMAMLKPGIDPALEKIVFKAMAKAPKQRHGGCGEFAIAIDRYLKRESSSRNWFTVAAAHIASTMQRAPRLTTASMLAVVILVGGASIGLPPWTWSGTAPAPVPTPAAPSIRLMASVDPGSVSQTGTTVTFGYQVTNGGDAPLKNVVIVDGGPTPPALVGGDTNRNGVLDSDETWQFKSQATIEQRNLDEGTLSRHVVARSDEATSDSRDVEVHIDRKPSLVIGALVNGTKSVQLTAPGPVAYTYIVSNLGNVALTGIAIRDDQDAAPTLRRGDSNGNKVLDVGERWEYRSTATIAPEVFAAGAPLVRRAIAVSDQLQSDPAEVTVTFEPRPIAPLRSGETVPVPRKLRNVLPIYPTEAQTAGVQGEVRVDLTIDKTGHVQEVRVVQSTAASASGPAPATLQALLNEAAITAARQWAYEPTVLNGVTVPVIVTANVRFVLTPRETSNPPTPAAPAPVRVGGDIKTPNKTRHIRAEYPAAAQAARVQGVVIIEVTIDSQGRVSNARILSSIPLLDQAALDAVRQWEYAPTLVNGVAVPVIMTVTVRFSIN